MCQENSGVRWYPNSLFNKDKEGSMFVIPEVIVLLMSTIFMFMVPGQLELYFD